MADEDEPQKKGFFQNFFEELDAFVDDATSRRLGNGAQYYGKRKSSFYGEGDANRKTNKVSHIDVSPFATCRLRKGRILVVH